MALSSLVFGPVNSGCLGLPTRSPQLGEAVGLRLHTPSLCHGLEAPSGQYSGAIIELTVFVPPPQESLLCCLMSETVVSFILSGSLVG